MESGTDIHSEDIELLQNIERTQHILNAYYITSFGEGNKLDVSFDYMSGENRSGYTSYWEQNRNVEAYDDGNYHLYVGKAQMSH